MSFGGGNLRPRVFSVGFAPIALPMATFWKVITEPTSGSVTKSTATSRRSVANAMPASPRCCGHAATPHPVPPSHGTRQPKTQSPYLTPTSREPRHERREHCLEAYRSGPNDDAFIAACRSSRSDDQGHCGDRSEGHEDRSGPREN